MGTEVEIDAGNVKNEFLGEGLANDDAIFTQPHRNHRVLSSPANKNANPLLAPSSFLPSFLPFPVYYMVQGDTS